MIASSTCVRRHRCCPEGLPESPSHSSCKCEENGGVDEEAIILLVDVPPISVFFKVQNEGLTEVEGSERLDSDLMFF